MVVADRQISQIPSDKIVWFRDRLFAWKENNLRDYPWRNTQKPYCILVAEFLLQRTDADTVEPVYRAFLSRYSSLEELNHAILSELALLLQPLGLFFRAERLYQTAQIITEEYGGAIPDTEAELLKLPGVGKYTARAICSQAFGQSAAVLDTNVARILERFYGLEGERVKSRCKILWQAAEIIAPDNTTPDNNIALWNLTLLDFGALTCTARKPKCSDCPLAAKCCWLESNKIDKQLIESL